MSDKLNVLLPTSFPEGVGVQNSGVGLTQLPPGHTAIKQGSPIAAMGAAIVGGFEGQFQQNTQISSNWLKDGKFGKK